MFFLIRCTFWLSLVFANLPDSPASTKVDANALLDMARSHFASFTQSGAAKKVASTGVEALAATALDQGAAWCKANGEACVDAILSTMLTKSGTADTLTTADRSTRRRG